MSGEQNQNIYDRKNPMANDAGSCTPPPQPDWRGLSERLKWLDKEIPQLVRQVRHLRRRLASVMAKRDRLQVEVNRFRGNIP